MTSESSNDERGEEVKFNIEKDLENLPQVVSYINNLQNKIKSQEKKLVKLRKRLRNKVKFSTWLL